MSRPIRLRTLGGLALEDGGGAPVSATVQRKRLALLVMLAAAGAGGVPRDRLLATLWPESDDESARHSLKQAVYALRSRLGDAALVTGPADLRLDPAAVASDVADFRRALAAGDHEAAVAHYAGPFLDGVHLGGAEFERWVDAERHALAERCAAALGALGARAQAAGDTGAAVGWYRRLAALDPLDAPRTRALVLALAESGDVAGAVRQAHLHERLLREQLDLPPDPTVAALAERLRARAGRDTATGPASGPAPESRMPESRTPGSPAPVETPWSAAHPAHAVAVATPPRGHAVPGERAAAPARVADASAAAPAPHKLAATVTPTSTAVPGRAPSPAPARWWLRLRPHHGLRRSLSAAGTPSGASEAATAPAPRTSVATSLALAGAWCLAALSTFVGSRLAPAASAHDDATQLVAVLPFRVSGAHPSLVYLREGAADLVVTELPGDVGPRAVAARETNGRWRQPPAATGDVSDEAARAAARTLGAGQVLVGTVIGAPSHVILTASLLAVADGHARAQASVAGPADSLPWLVERLVTGLLARSAHEPDWRLTALAAAPPAAARAYLAGRAALRANRRDDAVAAFGRALELAPSFAPAALGMASAGAWATTEADDHSRPALARAWTLRTRLSVADQALFQGYVGEHSSGHRTAAQELADWEAATQVAPTAAEAWYEYGDRLFHVGALVGADAPRERAAAAFARAVALDSGYTPARAHLAELAVLAGDTVAVRRAVAERPRTGTPLGEATDYVHWREAVFLGDSAARRALRATLPRMGDAALRRIVGYGQLEARALDDVEQAAAELRRRSITEAARQENAPLLHALALNRGQQPAGATSWWLAYPSARSSDTEGGQTLIEALYWDSSRPAADAAASALAARLSTARLAAAGTGTTPAAAAAAGARCALALWQLARGAPDDARAGLPVLPPPAAAGDVARDTLPADAGRVQLCRAVLAAELAVRDRRPEARALVATLDSLTRLGLPGPGVAFANLALARQLESLGDVRGALAAVRRRAYDWGPGPAFLSASLREEARLATLAGERVAARDALRRYQRLRSIPDTAPGAPGPQHFAASPP